MSDDQLAKWKAKLAKHHREQRRQRGKRREGDTVGAIKPGMVRRLPPQPSQPVTDDAEPGDEPVRYDPVLPSI